MFMGATGIKAVDEMEKFKKEQEELEKEQAARERRYSELGISNLRNNPWQFADGGAVPNPVVTAPATPAPGIGNIGAALRGKLGGIGAPTVTIPAPAAPVNAFGIPASMLGKIGALSGVNKKAQADKYKNAALDSLRNNPWQYAEGGAVDDNQGLYGTADGLAAGGSPLGYSNGGPLNYAAGGTTPRFLSGGGDGMSDSIPADGEFIIPADVVSHLGNGSSKAGAKQLYSMMDKVRAARTGTTKQGKQINPKKYLPA
jgi:hypothetical protein